MISPCVRLCVVDPGTGFCAGCGRTLTEIGGWLSYSHEERQAVMRMLPARLSAANTGERREAGR